MPCYDSRSDCDTGGYDRGFADGQAQVKRAGKLTRILCEGCRRLELHNKRMSPELRAWWERHKMIDKIGNGS